MNIETQLKEKVYESITLLSQFSVYDSNDHCVIDNLASYIPVFTRKSNHLPSHDTNVLLKIIDTDVVYTVEIKTSCLHNFLWDIYDGSKFELWYQGEPTCLFLDFVGLFDIPLLRVLMKRNKDYHLGILGPVSVLLKQPLPDCDNPEFAMYQEIDETSESDVIAYYKLTNGSYYGRENETF